MTSRRKRAKPQKPWNPMRDITAELSDAELGQRQRYGAINGETLIGVWSSEDYEVEHSTVEVPEFGFQMDWLSIKRRNKAAVHDWRHLQQIKNEILGPDREAVELYPAEARLVDTSNQYHLFALPAGKTFPFGYRARMIVDAKPSEDRHVRGTARQRPIQRGLEREGTITVAEADAMAQKFRKVSEQ